MPQAPVTVVPPAAARATSSVRGSSPFKVCHRWWLRARQTKERTHVDVPSLWRPALRSGAPHALALLPQSGPTVTGGSLAARRVALPLVLAGNLLTIESLATR